MNFQTFLSDFYGSFDPKGEQRIGQFFMNQLREKNIGIYLAIPWELDPYYEDNLLPQCIEWVSERWFG